MKVKTIITGNCTVCGNPIEAATCPQHFGRNKAKHLREECNGEKSAFDMVSMSSRQLRQAGRILIKASRLVKELKAI